MFISGAKYYGISSLSTFWKKAWLYRDPVKFKGRFCFEYILSVTILFPCDWIFWPQFWSHLNWFKGKIALQSLILNPYGKQGNLTHRFYSWVKIPMLWGNQYSAEDGRDSKPLAMAAWAWSDTYQLEPCSTNEVPGKTLQRRAILGCFISLPIVFILH